MITISSEQLHLWMAAFLFPLARILAMISSAPILGNRQVPVRVKIGLAIFITLIVAPTLDPMPAVSPGSAAGLMILLQQIIIGIAMGFTLRLIFTAVEMAGEIAGLQMGLGFASFYDPMNSAYTPVVARWLGMITALIFLALNGHLQMLAALAESFQTIPIGSWMTAQGYLGVAQWGSHLFSYALQFSLPLLATLLITNIGLGILTRAAPQLNLFAVGFPVTLSIGFIALALTLQYLPSLLEHMTRLGLESILSRR